MLPKKSGIMNFGSKFYSFSTESSNRQTVYNAIKIRSPVSSPKCGVQSKYKDDWWIPWHMPVSGIWEPQRQVTLAFKMKSEQIVLSFVLQCLFSQFLPKEVASWSKEAIMLVAYLYPYAWWKLSSPSYVKWAHRCPSFRWRSVCISGPENICI